LADRRRALEEARTARVAKAPDAAPAAASAAKPAAAPARPAPAAPGSKVKSLLEEVEKIATELGVLSSPGAPAAPKEEKGKGKSKKGASPVEHIKSVCKKAADGMAESKVAGAEKVADAFREIAEAADSLEGKDLTEGSVRPTYHGIVRGLLDALALVHEDWKRIGVSESCYANLRKMVEAEEPEAGAPPAEPVKKPQDAKAALSDAVETLKKAANSGSYGEALAAAADVVNDIKKLVQNADPAMAANLGKAAVALAEYAGSMR
jgi:hypothetical protein